MKQFCNRISVLNGCTAGNIWLQCAISSLPCCTKNRKMPYSRSSKCFTGFLSIEEVEGSENFTRRFFKLNKANSQLEYYADDPSQVAYCFSQLLDYWLNKSHLYGFLMNGCPEWCRWYYYVTNKVFVRRQGCSRTWIILDV